MAATFVPPSPVRDPDNAPFFDAAREGRLLIKTCDACRETFFYPRALCPFCQSDSHWTEASGRGVIYSCTKVATRDGGYVLALVSLAEGPAMLTNILAGEGETISVGQAVQVTFVESDGDERVPMFVPEPAR